MQNISPGLCWNPWIWNKIHGSRVDGQELLAVRGSSGHCSRREPTMYVVLHGNSHKRDYPVGMEIFTILVIEL